MVPTEKKTLLTRQHAADRLEVSKRTLMRWDKRGITKPKRFGRLVRYDADEINQLCSTGAVI